MAKKKLKKGSLGYPCYIAYYYYTPEVDKVLAHEQIVLNESPKNYDVFLQLKAHLEKKRGSTVVIVNLIEFKPVPMEDDKDV